MALSDEEKRGLLAEAADSRRAELLREIQRRRIVEAPVDLLAFLEQGTMLLVPGGPRYRRPGITGKRFIL